MEMTDCVRKAGREVQFVCVTGDVCESVCWWKAGGIIVICLMCVSFRLCASEFGQAVCNLFPLTSNPPTYLNLVIQLEYYRGQGPAPGLDGPDLVYCNDFN